MPFVRKKPRERKIKIQDMGNQGCFNIYFKQRDKSGKR